MRKRWSLACGLVALVLAVGIAYATVPSVIEITVSPNTLYLAAQGSWVTVHTNIPYGEVYTALLTLDGIPVAWTKTDSKGNLVAKFTLGDVQGILEPGPAVLTLEGTTTAGDFSASDDVTVIAAK